MEQATWYRSLLRPSMPSRFLHDTSLSETQTHRVHSVHCRLNKFLWCVTDVRCRHWLQVLPGDVRVSAGSGTWWRPAQRQDVGSQRGNPLGAKLSVDEVQVCADDNYRRVWSTCLPQHIKNFSLNISPICQHNTRMLPDETWWNFRHRQNQMKAWITILSHITAEFLKLIAQKGLSNCLQHPVWQ